jgi:hypothetical protein
VGGKIKIEIHKIFENSWIAERLAACQVSLSFMELVENNFSSEFIVYF